MTRLATHLDVPINETERIRERPQELAYPGPFPICSELLDEWGRWGRGRKGFDGRDGHGGEDAFGHPTRV